MSTNEDIAKRLIAVIKSKTEDRPSTCPICGNKSWSLNPRYLVLPVSEKPHEYTIGGEIMPFAIMTCKHCGNTQLINLLALGFKEDDFKSLGFSKDVKE